MKSTAQFLGLLFAALAVSARAADTPAASTPPAAAAPVPATPAETKKADLPAEAPAKTETTATPFAFNVPFTPLASPAAEEKPADPNVLELPKMVVKQKPRPRLTPEIMVTKKAFGEQLAKEKFSGLDQALNKFTLPLFGTSIAERALEEHEREKKAQLAQDTAVISEALESVDPAEAKSLKDAAARP